MQLDTKTVHMLQPPWGKTRPSGSVIGCAARRLIPQTGGCILRLSLMHMFINCSLLISSL